MSDPDQSLPSGGSGPGLEGVVHENTSGHDLGSQTTRYNKAPGISGQVRENQSKNNATNQGPYVNGHRPSLKDVRPGQNSLVATGTGGLGTTEYGSGSGLELI